VDWERPADLDLGDGHELWFLEWDPDRDLNSQWKDLPPIAPGEHCVAFIAHPAGPSAEKWKETEVGEGRCFSAIHFDIPRMRRAWQGVNLWAVTNWEPLTVWPSILCHCGDHGFITEGKWRRA